jgi:hypothetical protein
MIIILICQHLAGIKESLILISSGVKPEVLDKEDFLKFGAAEYLAHKGSGIPPQSL